MDFPRYRPRRLRRNEKLRAMVREASLAPANLIYPLFVGPGKDIVQPVSSMPGVAQLSVDHALRECEEAQSLGIPAVILFGLPKHKDAVGSEAYDDDGIVQQAIREIKSKLPELLVITDVCLCEYTDHGHCGVIENGEVDNDSTLELLARESLSHARAGADIVAPSDMMDGRVAAIRDALDKEDFEDVAVLSYAVKYASAYYGPFRDAAESAPAHGDRQSHQMDCRNVREALKEAALDESEGADILMVKPALPCLDVIAAIRGASALPLAAYNVSGEYAAVKAAAASGWMDEPRAVRENLIAIRRAGADMIITYHARDALRGGWL